MKLEEAKEIMGFFVNNIAVEGVKVFELKDACKTALQEIEHLQKENERYENKIILSDEEYRRVIDAAQKDCVSKDKIREKIKRLEEEEKAELSEFEKRKRLVLPTDTPYLFASAEYSWKKEVLNNLLKEE